MEHLNASANTDRSELTPTERVILLDGIRQAWPVHSRSAETIAAHANTIVGGEARDSATEKSSNARLRGRWLRWSYVALGTAVGAIALMHVRMAPSASPVREYTTRVGEHTTVTLPDGSTLRLAPASHLTVHTTFGRTNRSVQLTGEASFDVAPSAHSPFVVQTGKIATRVLGTTFSVRHYADDSSVRVQVQQGKVTVSNVRTTVALTEGIAAEVNDSTVVRAGMDLNTTTDWTHGQLVFKRAPVPEMLATVSRWSGYELRLADSTLNTRTVSAVFNIADFQETLVAIQSLLDVRMRYDGKVVTLQRRARAPESHVPFNAERRDTAPFSPLKEAGR